MEIIRLRDEYIRLGQAMKAGGLCDRGSDAKAEITSGAVKVNGETELRRGRKLRDGDLVEYNGRQVKIEA